MKSVWAVAVACGIATSGSVTYAAEETLNFRLVIRHMVTNTHTNTAIEGLELSAMQSIGVAVFDDGRIAYKEFVVLGYRGETPAPAPGFSSYVFENGDSIQLQFTAGPGEGGFFVNYDVLSGTGAYEGATGTGQLKLVPTEWDDANLFEGSITVTTP